MPITGGAIGQGLPVAVGAAVACPDRKVVALQADGSAMYTLQSLWTMARETAGRGGGDPGESPLPDSGDRERRTGAADIGPRANDMMDLTHPDLDWVKLAEGQGVSSWPRDYRRPIRRPVPRRRKAPRSGADRSRSRVTVNRLPNGRGSVSRYEPRA